MDTWTRQAAIPRVDVGQAAARFGLRRALWQDRDAAVRAAAALQLGRTKTQSDSPTVADVASWLGDACGDESPLVREAALRALARMANRLPVLSRAERAKSAASLAFTDPIWWVRRAALLAYGALLSLQPESALPMLRAKLADPFWRVRHAAAQALYAIGLRVPALRETILAPSPDLSGPAQAGLWYLRARFQPAIEVHSFSSRSPDGPLANADPAVITARLRAQAFEALDPQALVPFFADPHEPLRRLAVEQLRALVRSRSAQHGSDSQPVQDLLHALLPWLETPTQPHAAETTAVFLDGLGDPAQVLCRALLGQPQPSPGALGWACSYAAQIGDEDLLPLLLRHSQHPKATSRAAVMAALVSLAPLAERTRAQFESRPESIAIRDALHQAWGRALADDSSEVRSLALLGMAQSTDAALHPLALRQALSSLLPAARLALVELAARHGQTALLHRAQRDPHPLVRARALRALRSRSLLPAATLEGALCDRDPEVRLAVLPAQPQAWMSLLRDDPDPSVRRAALRALISKRACETLGPDASTQAALLASTAADPWLRTQAAATLRADQADELCALLRLSRDAEESVRAAAADGLQDPVSAGPLRALLQADTSDPSRTLSDAERAAAYAWVVTHEGAGALDLIHRATTSTAEPVAVREVLPALRLLAGGDADESSEPAPPAAAARPAMTASPPAAAARRTLGRTGIRVSPLGISGAYEPPLSALHRARQAGVNLFFWEPSYLKLTRFLRRQCQAGPATRQDLVIVAGSFEGDRVGIERDVARALRRLRTSYLDVLLLLWVRSPERLSPEALDCLRELKRRGTIRAFGFSTHQRELAESAAQSGDWDVLMLRHSAAHPGAEDRLLPLCAAKQVGVITFSALSYGRLLRPQPAVSEAQPRREDGAEHAPRFDGAEPPALAQGEQIGPLPTAADCYRYTLSQPGVTACWSAPRSHSELAENLVVLNMGPLPSEDCARLRRHGQLVHAEDRRFRAFLRKGHDGAPEILAQIPAPPIAVEAAGETGEAAAIEIAEALSDLGEATAPVSASGLTDTAIAEGALPDGDFDDPVTPPDDLRTPAGSETGEDAPAAEPSDWVRSSALWSATWPTWSPPPSGTLRSLLSRRRKPEKM